MPLGIYRVQKLAIRKTQYSTLYMHTGTERMKGSRNRNAKWRNQDILLDHDIKWDCVSGPHKQRVQAKLPRVEYM